MFFDLAGNPFTPPTLKRLRVSAAGQSGDYEFDVTGKTVGAMGWTGRHFDFVANSAQTTLRFKMLNSATVFGPAIDNVRVLRITTVPALPAGGLTVLGALLLTIMYVTMLRARPR